MAFEGVSAECSEFDHGRDGQAVLSVVRMIVERISPISAVHVACGAVNSRGSTLAQITIRSLAKRAD